MLNFFRVLTSELLFSRFVVVSVRIDESVSQIGSVRGAGRTVSGTPRNRRRSAARAVHSRNEIFKSRAVSVSRHNCIQRSCSFFVTKTFENVCRE